ncbi:MAG: class F sortase [Thermomicrobiales bacterium]|nr:class F sortase [Thermomicrobiales bacterium]
MDTMRSPRTRRSFLAAMTAAAVSSRVMLAQETPESTPEQVPIESTTTGELPSSGALRGGPVGQNSPQVRAANPSAPANIVIESIGVNADIEQLDIVDGVMENPTGPWVVSWYRQTATLGEPGNVVLAGHVDFWNVGPSVFFNIRNLTEGEEILLTGEDGRTATYAVEWVETFDNETLEGGKLQEVVGVTGYQALTMITCGGEFDHVNGHYLSRTVVRARFVEPPMSTPEGTPDA